MVSTGETMVLLASGYGKGVSVGRSELVSSGLTRVLDGVDGAVGPVGAKIVLLAEGYGYGRSDCSELETELVSGSGAGAVGPGVGAITVPLAEGYGYGVSAGRSDDESSGLATELDGAVGPSVGATTVLFGDG